LALICLGLVVTGCDAGNWVGHGAFAVGGYILGRLTAPVQVETTCFRDGIEVDCSTVPR